MKIRIALIALGIASSVAGCATRESGVRDPVRFREIAETTEFSSAAAPEALARCFENNAALLPMSDFRADAGSAAVTYRLRGFGFTFEEIDFFADGESNPAGSRVVVRLAPGVNAKWRRDFERDRMTPLRNCAAG